MEKEIKNLVNCPVTKSGSLYCKILMICSIIFGPFIPIQLLSISVGHYYPGHDGYYFIASMIWGFLYGWFEPVRIFYRKKSTRIIKALEEYRMQFQRLGQISKAIYFDSQLLGELICHEKINAADLILYDNSYYFQKSFPFLSSIVDLGIEPKKIIISKRKIPADYLLYFKDENDYNLAKLCGKEMPTIHFFKGQELLRICEKKS